ncbi:hypothetical protein D3C84_816560 [compost metagenome]
MASISFSIRSNRAVRIGLRTSFGTASTRRRPSGVLMIALPLTSRNSLRLSSVMIAARVAEVPMPSPSLSIFFSSGSSTKLWMFSIALPRVPSVKRSGALVLTALTPAPVHCTASPFLTLGSIWVGSLPFSSSSSFG